MYNVNLTLEIRPWVTVMTHPWVTDNIIQIQQCVEELWPRRQFWVCVHIDLDLGDMAFGQGHDTPLSHGQQFCEKLSRSNKTLRSYSPNTDFGYVYTATLALEI